MKFIGFYEPKRKLIEVALTQAQIEILLCEIGLLNRELKYYRDRKYAHTKILKTNSEPLLKRLETITQRLNKLEKQLYENILTYTGEPESVLGTKAFKRKAAKILKVAVETWAKTSEAIEIAEQLKSKDNISSKLLIEATEVINHIEPLQNRLKKIIESL